jgi:ApaG protein
MYETVTRGIRVRCTPQYLEEESAPDEDRFFWAYTIEINNDGDETVQLRSRHWRITDGEGRTEEVRGPGVVGETPVLEPGGSFRYTSGCSLDTPSGIMVGTYQMTTDTGELFNVAIPAFSLDSPHAKRSLN